MVIFPVTKVKNGLRGSEEGGRLRECAGSAPDEGEYWRSRFINKISKLASPARKWRVRKSAEVHPSRNSMRRVKELRVKDSEKSEKLLSRAQ
jgi:hypothetical protein